MSERIAQPSANTSRPADTLQGFFVGVQSRQRVDDCKFAPALVELPKVGGSDGGSSVATRLSEIAVYTPPEVDLAACANSGARTQRALLGHITIETHVICGANDVICPLPAAQAMAERIPGYTRAVTQTAGAGHAPFLTQPDAFNAALRSAIS